MNIDMEKIKDSLDKAAVYTVKTTDKAVTSAKLTIKKTKLRGKLESEYKELGRLVYLNAVREEGTLDFEDSFNSIKEKIDLLLVEIKECDEKIEENKEG